MHCIRGLCFLRFWKMKFSVALAVILCAGKPAAAREDSARLAGSNRVEVCAVGEAPLGGRWGHPALAGALVTLPSSKNMHPRVGILYGSGSWAGFSTPYPANGTDTFQSFGTAERLNGAAVMVGVEMRKDVWPGIFLTAAVDARGTMLRQRLAVEHRLQVINTTPGAPPFTAPWPPYTTIAGSTTIYEGPQLEVAVMPAFGLRAVRTRWTAGLEWALRHEYIYSAYFRGDGSFRRQGILSSDLSSWSLRAMAGIRI